MHQSLFIIEAFLKGNHSFRTADTIDIIDFKNNVFGVVGIFRPYFTENIELTRCNMCDGYVRYLFQTFDYKFGLMCFFQEYTDVGNECIS